MTLVAEGVEIKYDRLCVIPLGGQSEIGRALWAFCYAGEILLIDAGASYPNSDLPGVDLLLPNTSFLQMNKERITALVLTNGHEEHCGAVAYLLDHIKIPRIMAPRFVASLVSQRLIKAADGRHADTAIDTVETRHSYQIGAFQVEWIKVNDAIADACALKLWTPEGTVIYTSSFKLDQTPIDGRQMDIAKIAEAGDQGVALLISDSAGVENHAYTPSEKVTARGFEKHISEAEGRAIVVMNATNTLRMQVLFDLAKQLNRKVVLYGDALVETAVAAVITGNLSYDRSIEATLKDLDRLKESEVLVLATGEDGDAMLLMQMLSRNKCKDFALRRGDTVVYSSEIYPGESRKMAMNLDRLLSMGVHSFIGVKAGVHVSNHAGREELKLMLSLAKPRFFVPTLGEGRHIMHHAQLAKDFGISPENVFPLGNGSILEFTNGGASVIGSVEAQAVFYNRDQEESVTAFSVNERRSLCMEGVLIVGLLLSPDGELIQAPAFEGAALGFQQANEWRVVQSDLIQAITDLVAKQREENPGEIAALRSSVRDVVAKALRSKLSSKPAIHVVFHEAPVKVAPERK